MKKITIIIEPDGSSKIDAEGFKGQCSVATRELELALAGTNEVKDNKKPDYYQSIGQSQTLRG
jgi:hypothetical protein